MSTERVTIDLASAHSPALLDLLRRHPRIERVVESVSDELTFVQAGRTRTVFSGRPDIEVAGLIEIMDNNPLVCADEASVPDAVSTLALIALAPIARAGLIVEQPAMMTNLAANREAVDAFLRRESWSGGLAIDADAKDFGGAAVATVIATVHVGDAREIDDLYEEAYGRSFCIRMGGSPSWDVAEVVGTPIAAYRLRFGAEESGGLVTIQVMADAEGKCGAAQMVHMMNVMAGIEESVL